MPRVSCGTPMSSRRWWTPSTRPSVHSPLTGPTHLPPPNISNQPHCSHLRPSVAVVSVRSSTQARSALALARLMVSVAGRTYPVRPITPSTTGQTPLPLHASIVWGMSAPLIRVRSPKTRDGYLTLWRRGGPREGCITQCRARNSTRYPRMAQLGRKSKKCMWWSKTPTRISPTKRALSRTNKTPLEFPSIDWCLPESKRIMIMKRGIFSS